MRMARGWLVALVSAAGLLAAGSLAAAPATALAAGPRVSPSTAPAGMVLADNGFRPRTNGFSFANYGANEPFDNLTAAEMLRLFGDAVCVRSVSNQCTLTPEAQQWMNQSNLEMDGGHCYGFSVLSLALFKHQLPEFGAGLTFSVAIQDNPIVQRTIAYTMSQQDLDSVNDRRVTGTPDQILTKLIASLSPSSRQTYTLGIFKRDGTGGHAITPFKVVSRGGGKVSLLVYDNNYPGRTRTVSFDVTRDAWSYNASVNPQATSALYDGDAQSPDLMLMPTTPGLGVQPCPFCRRQRSDAAPGRSLIQLDGNPTQHAHLMISGPHGRIGITPGDTPVNTLPGARVIPVLESDITERREPLYDIPDRPDTITLDAAGLRRRDTESVSSIGPGHSVAVGGIRIAPGERDVISLAAGDRGVSFRSAVGQHGSPQIRVNLDGAKSDLAVTANLLNFHPGATFRIKINADESKLTVSQQGNPGTGRYAVHLARYTKHGIKPIGVRKVRLTGSQSVTDDL
jgi:hypothetical protein